VRPGIRLYRHSRQRRLNVAGLHEGGLESCLLGEARIEPVREWTGLEADPRQRKALEELHQRFRVGLHLGLLHNLAGYVDNAHA
jgi:hypothetical protein